MKEESSPPVSASKGGGGGTDLRTLKVVCGIAVLITVLHLGHGLHHIFAHANHHGIAFWAGATLAAVVGVFSFIGGVLLFKPGP